MLGRKWCFLRVALSFSENYWIILKFRYVLEEKKFYVPANDEQRRGVTITIFVHVPRYHLKLLLLML